MVKITQINKTFEPVTIVLENEDELKYIFELVNMGSPNSYIHPDKLVELQEKVNKSDKFYKPLEKIMGEYGIKSFLEEE